MLRGMLAALSLMSNVAAHAADITLQAASPAERPVIRIGGDFLAGDQRRFIELALPLDDALVIFDNSNGGSLDAALQIGKAIRLKEFDTSVAANAECASACAYTWLAGERRYMEPQARVGFHAAYQIDAEGNAKTSGTGNALIGAYLAGLALSTEALLYITDAGPNEMRWLTLETVNGVGIFAQPSEISTAAKATQPQSEPGVTPPKSEPVPNSAFIVKKGVEFIGLDLWKTQVLNLEDCQQKCIAEKGLCNAYTFDIKTSICNAKLLAKTSVRNAQMISGFHVGQKKYIKELP